MKRIKLIGLLTFVFASASSYAGVDDWNSELVYKSGDLVEWKGHKYIASHWTKGIEPLPNNINWDGWIYIDKDKLTIWDSNRVYKGGEIVEINGDYYLASWWNKNEYPETASSWQHLVDVKLDLEPEPMPDNNTIEGIDLDHNGVRDDYERAISEIYVDDDLIKVAISASQEWKSLIKISLDEDIIITQGFASEKFSNLISLNKCFSELRRINPQFETPSKLYFNTLDRAMEKRKAENKLFKALKGDLRSVHVAESPCLNTDLVK